MSAIIADGYTKYADRKLERRYKAVLRVDRVPVLSRRTFDTASQAVAYGERWAVRLRTLRCAATHQATAMKGKAAPVC